MAVKKYIAVNAVWLKKWSKDLQDVISEKEASEEWHKAYRTKHQIDMVLQNGDEVPLSLVKSFDHITKFDVVQSLGIKNTVDYALPQGWVDHMTDFLGESPVPHFVWVYDGESGGRPLPITPTGEVLLRVANHLNSQNS